MGVSIVVKNVVGVLVPFHNQRRKMNLELLELAKSLEKLQDGKVLRKLTLAALRAIHHDLSLAQAEVFQYLLVRLEQRAGGQKHHS